MTRIVQVVAIAMFSCFGLISTQAAVYRAPSDFDGLPMGIGVDGNRITIAFGSSAGAGFIRYDRTNVTWRRLSHVRSGNSTFYRAQTSPDGRIVTVDSWQNQTTGIALHHLDGIAMPLAGTNSSALAVKQVTVGGTNSVVVFGNTHHHELQGLLSCWWDATGAFHWLPAPTNDLYNGRTSALRFHQSGENFIWCGAGWGEDRGGYAPFFGDLESATMLPLPTNNLSWGFANDLNEEATAIVGWIDYKPVVWQKNCDNQYVYKFLHVSEKLEEGQALRISGPVVGGFLGDLFSTPEGFIASAITGKTFRIVDWLRLRNIRLEVPIKFVYDVLVKNNTLYILTDSDDALLISLPYNANDFSSDIKVEISKQVKDVTVGFPTIAGERYVIQESPSSDGPWENTTDFIADGERFDTVIPSTQKSSFFKVFLCSESDFVPNPFAADTLAAIDLLPLKAREETVHTVTKVWQ